MLSHEMRKTNKKTYFTVKSKLRDVNIFYKKGDL